MAEESKEAKAKQEALRLSNLNQWIEYFAIGIATAVLALLMLYGIVLYTLHLR